jgi:sec-independent protein translocase protein TatA
MDIGPTELIIILVIVLLIFGVGRLGKIGKEMGTAIHEFRKGLQSDEQEPPKAEAVEANQPKT